MGPGSAGFASRARRLVLTAAILAVAALAAPAPVALSPSAAPAAVAGADVATPAAAYDALYAAWRPLLAREAALPGAAPRDVYKLLYQGVMGPAHGGLDAAGALVWLREEWSGMRPQAPPGPDAAAPAVQPIRPDSQLVRVHLGPLLARLLHGAPARAESSLTDAALERLAIAFARTADSWRPEPGELRALWARAVADTELWRPAGGVAAAVALGQELERAGWPAVHHGEAYVARQSPHYRVVARALLPPAWRGEEAP